MPRAIGKSCLRWRFITAGCRPTIVITHQKINMRRSKGEKIVAKKSLMDKFKELVKASAKSNVPMTGREIAKTKA